MPSGTTETRRRGRDGGRRRGRGCGRGGGRGSGGAAGAALLGLLLSLGTGSATSATPPVIAATAPGPGGASGAGPARLAGPTGGDAGPTSPEASPGVFAPEPGQEYELAFFIAAALLTVLVAGGFIAVIVLHGRGSGAADREAEAHEVEA